MACLDRSVVCKVEDGGISEVRVPKSMMMVHRILGYLKWKLISRGRLTTGTVALAYLINTLIIIFTCEAEEWKCACVVDSG